MDNVARQAWETGGQGLGGWLVIVTIHGILDVRVYGWLSTPGVYTDLLPSAFARHHLHVVRIAAVLPFLPSAYIKTAGWSE